jgi:hypothetical protein
MGDEQSRFRWTVGILVTLLGVCVSVAAIYFGLPKSDKQPEIAPKSEEAPVVVNKRPEGSRVPPPPNMTKPGVTVQPPPSMGKR